MAFPTAVLLLGVSELLLKRWKPKLRDNPQLLPGDLELADGLRRLIINNDELTKLFDGVTNATKVDLGSVEEVIKEFQQDIGALKVDGILGSKSLSDLIAALACFKPLQDPTTKVSEAFREMVKQIKQKSDNSRTDRNETWYLYYVEELPIVPGASADLLVKNAWSLWQKYANVKVERLRKPLKDAANVVFKTANLPGSVLGRADQPDGPSPYVLEIEMDSSRNWDPVMFEGAVAHEIGHVLGLKHQSVPGLLMSPYVQRNWREHFEIDGKRAADLPWLGDPIEIVHPERRTGIFTGLGGPRRRENS